MPGRRCSPGAGGGEAATVPTAAGRRSQPSAAGSEKSRRSSSGRRLHSPSPLTLASQRSVMQHLLQSSLLTQIPRSLMLSR